MTTRPIERTGRVECIACNAWVLPNERLRAAFVGGHNVRFYVCLQCISAYKKPVLCHKCSIPLTVQNAYLRTLRGRLIMQEKICIDCKNENRRLNHGYRKPKG